MAESEAAAPRVLACRTPPDSKSHATVTLCWCECELPALAAAGSLDFGASGGDVAKLHEHLLQLGMRIELSERKGGAWHDSTDLTGASWGIPTARALRMFASHPAVASEPRAVLQLDGKSLTKELATKIRTWCRRGVTSPQRYTEHPTLRIKPKDRDAFGSAVDYEQQTVLHDFVLQLEHDLAVTGFAPHSDKLCGLNVSERATGICHVVDAVAGRGKERRHEDRNLTDVSYLVKKFQRQAKWLWRMGKDGVHQPDAKPTDPSYYAGEQTGEVDHATAKALHHWAERGLHIVIAKFELKTLHWPPDSSEVIASDGGKPAKLRADAYEHWLAAARTVERLGGTLAGPYASSPRALNKPKDDSASVYSWHYSGLAIDLNDLVNADGSVSRKRPYGIEKEGRQFRLWCWLPDGPPAEMSASDQQYVHERNRNIKPGPRHPAHHLPRGALVYGADMNYPPQSDQLIQESSSPTEADVLYFAVHVPDQASIDKKKGYRDSLDVTARQGWYLDLTAILKASGFTSIDRHDNWVTDKPGAEPPTLILKDKAWEHWHYEYKPPNPAGALTPPTFGELVQLYGVHELTLRTRGWSSHEEVDHVASPSA